jgi:hypothetical protein
MEGPLRIFFFIAALLVAVPAVAAPPTPQQLELRTWEAFKDKRVSEFKSMFASDFVGVYADGTHDLATEMKAFDRVTLRDYALKNFTTKALDADNVLLTYAADIRGTVSGKAVSERLWAASLWHRMNGKWLCVYHTEIKTA